MTIWSVYAVFSCDAGHEERISRIDVGGETSRSAGMVAVRRELAQGDRFRCRHILQDGITCCKAMTAKRVELSTGCRHGCYQGICRAVYDVSEEQCEEMQG